MFPCPRCTVRMQRRFLQRGVTWACPSCGGRTATVPMLRRALGRHVVEGLWRSPDVVSAEDGARCPSCLHVMREVEVRAPGGAQTLDTCRRCHFVWFDPGEYHAFGALAERAALRTPGTRTRDADAPIERRPARDRGTAPPWRREAKHPDQGWKWLPALLGMPVEFESRPLKGYPWATWTLLSLILGLGVLALHNLEPLVARYAFLPSDPMRLAGLTPLTSFFLHAGWLHLLGNAYFLWIFGDNTEDALGLPRYLLLVVLATYAGAAAHGLTTGTPDIPCVGASGGISGVLAYYAFRFPRVRLGLLFYFVFWLRISALTCFIVWVVLQLLGAYLATGGVAYTAHLGGAVIGIVFWFFDPDRTTTQADEARPRRRRRKRRRRAHDPTTPEDGSRAGLVQ